MSANIVEKVAAIKAGGYNPVAQRALEQIVDDLLARLAEAEKLREEDMLAFEATQIRRDEQNLQLRARLAEMREERDALAADLAKAREALRMLMDEKIDYMKINNLGDPEAQHTMKVARALVGEKP